MIVQLTFSRGAIRYPHNSKRTWGTQVKNKKVLNAIVFVTAGILAVPGISMAEHSYIRGQINSSNAADRWHGNQLRRGQEARRKGNVRIAQEIESFAERRTVLVKTITGGLGEDMWHGPFHTVGDFR